MKKEQTVIRVYPDGYTGDSIGKLRKMLSEGWFVKMVNTSEKKHTGARINDYILERRSPHEPTR